jgi:8-oxo-dGTP pyrophosphatase MutT (NUDIX family)
LFPQVHIHEDHNPSSHEESFFPNQLYNFALVICKHPITHKFLLCQEFANQGYWCPGGGVDPGEILSVAAKRETVEEAGVDVELKGILAIEYNPLGRDERISRNIVRMRIIFYAEPTEFGLSQLPKSSPDYESVGACWCSYEEIKELQTMRALRSNEPATWSK